MKKIHQTKQGVLVLVRHGESRFNELNLFSGWLDIPLTSRGVAEAQKVAAHCGQFDYDAVFTSHLERAHETLLVILSMQKKIGIFQHNSDYRYDLSKESSSGLQKKILPVITCRELNERSYGVLQGMNKQHAVRTYGKTQVFAWRRGFYDRPPKGENLADVYTRAVPYFQTMVVPRLRQGQSILVVGHGNTLRAIIKYMEDIPDEKMPFIDLPFARPIVYHFADKGFKKIKGKYNFKRKLR